MDKDNKATCCKLSYIKGQLDLIAKIKTDVGNLLEKSEGSDLILDIINLLKKLEPGSNKDDYTEHDDIDVPHIKEDDKIYSTNDVNIMIWDLVEQIESSYDITEVTKAWIIKNL